MSRFSGIVLHSITDEESVIERTPIRHLESQHDPVEDSAMVSGVAKWSSNDRSGQQSRSPSAGEEEMFTA
jgi:hypothetical protein